MSHNFVFIWLNPIQYGLFLKHYGMEGGGIMASPCNFAVS